jgi:hypothetical protein
MSGFEGANADEMQKRRIKGRIRGEHLEKEKFNFGYFYAVIPIEIL